MENKMPKPTFPKHKFIEKMGDNYPMYIILVLMAIVIIIFFGNEYYKSHQLKKDKRLYYN